MKFGARAACMMLVFAMLLSGCARTENNDTPSASDVTETAAVSTEDTAEITGAVAGTETAESTETTAVTEAETETTVATEATETSATEPVTEAPSDGVEFIGTKYTKDQLRALDTTKSGYGQGVRVDADNRPEGAVVMQNRYGQYDAVFIAPKSEYVYLTFDLGWENGYTAPIIDTLNEKGVKGVFFVTMDYCRSSPDIVKRIIDEGHILGNHSVHHYSMPTLTIEQMEEEIMGMHNYIKDTYGYEMTLFRPPMGEFSEQSLAVAQSLGYQTMQWSFAYYDYDVNNQPTYQDAFDRVSGAVHGGAVYLLHAVSSANAAILGDVIDDIRAKGFTIATYKS